MKAFSKNTVNFSTFLKIFREIVDLEEKSVERLSAFENSKVLVKMSLTKFSLSLQLGFGLLEGKTLAN